VPLTHLLNTANASSPSSGPSICTAGCAPANAVRLLIGIAGLSPSARMMSACDAPNTMRLMPAQNSAPALLQLANGAGIRP
jgi:hypothetical protein